MDDFKQLSPNELTVSNEYHSLTAALSAHGKTIGDLLIEYKEPGRLSNLVGRSKREVEEYLRDFQQESLIQPDDIEGLLLFNFIATGLPTIDSELGGGIPVGEITEIFGASGCGKSHLLNQLALNCQLDGSECIYICTESFLETKRLQDMSRDSTSSLDNISYIYCQNLEIQDHILYTQLPTKLQQNPSTRLVIIDSIAQHLRRENMVVTSTYLKSKIDQQMSQLSLYEDYDNIKKYHETMLKKLSKSESYANKSSKYYYLLLLHRHLQRLAEKFKVAIVLVNQVSDNTNVASDSSLYDLTNDALNLDFQTSIISGWDAKTLYDYFDNSNNPVSVNSMELEMIKYELANSLQKNDAKTRKYQGELISKLHTLDNVHTKRQVPTLGYLWGKRIATRILLMKTYKPLIDEHAESVEDDKQIPDPANTTTSPLDDVLKDIPKLQAIDALVNKWHLQRYAKVVSCNHNIYKNNSKVQFEITQDGITEVD